ncbi:hypothetical protein [Xanthomonas arboricola]|uniref:hypothetical protein n=1 Tax=Xanthomonas arboricola TaxID=56448 RepID=UPI0011B0C132|nr:hypothetical protein [Xanthomonas arboricola]
MASTVGGGLNVKAGSLNQMTALHRSGFNSCTATFHTKVVVEMVRLANIRVTASDRFKVFGLIQPYSALPLNYAMFLFELCRT